MAEPIKLYEGDPRCKALHDAIMALIYERTLGWPTPLVLGVIRIVEWNLLKDQFEE